MKFDQLLYLSSILVKTPWWW